MCTINPATVAVAREFRGLTQSELAQRIGVNQATISRVEKGFSPATEELARALSEALAFPRAFFYEPVRDRCLPLAFYRKRVAVSQGCVKFVEAQTNILRMHLAKLLTAFEDVKVKIRHIDLESYAGGAEAAAQDLRIQWSLRPGPIANLTNVMEPAGIIIVPCDFGTPLIDGISVYEDDLPPVIFVKRNAPADRCRFTLAHELAHVLFHHHVFLPPISRDLEDEANIFASELLMPAADIRGEFTERVTLEDLAALKSYWRVSIQALIMRGASLGLVSDMRKRYLFSQMSRLGYTKSEPGSLASEEPATLKTVLDYHLRKVGNSVNELAAVLAAFPDDLVRLYPELGKPRLHVWRLAPDS